MAMTSLRHSIVEQVQNEHEQIEELFSTIQRNFEGGLRNAPLVRRLLAELVVQAEEHITHEEEGGYFDEVTEDSPQYSHTVAGLLEEHRELLCSCRQLLAGADQAPDSSIWLRAIQHDFDCFVRHWLDHERRENELVQRAYTQEFGALD